MQPYQWKAVNKLERTDHSVSLLHESNLVMINLFQDGISHV